MNSPSSSISEIVSCRPLIPPCEHRSETRPNLLTGWPFQTVGNSKAKLLYSVDQRTHALLEHREQFPGSTAFTVHVRNDFDPKMGKQLF